MYRKAGSEVAKELLFLAPVHGGGPPPLASGEDFPLGLSSCGTQGQAAVYEGV